MDEFPNARAHTYRARVQQSLMTKPIIRISALLLLPCLMVDPATTGGLQYHPSGDKGLSKRFCFDEQALGIPTYTSRLPKRTVGAHIVEVAAQAIERRYTPEQQQLWNAIEARLPEGTIPALSATALDLLLELVDTLAYIKMATVRTLIDVPEIAIPSITDAVNYLKESRIRPAAISVQLKTEEIPDALEPPASEPVELEKVAGLGGLQQETPVGIPRGGIWLEEIPESMAAAVTLGVRTVCKELNSRMARKFSIFLQSLGGRAVPGAEWNTKKEKLKPLQDGTLPLEEAFDLLGVVPDPLNPSLTQGNLRFHFVVNSGSSIGASIWEKLFRRQKLIGIMVGGDVLILSRAYEMLSDDQKAFVLEYARLLEIAAREHHPKGPSPFAQVIGELGVARYNRTARDMNTNLRKLRRTPIPGGMHRMLNARTRRAIRRKQKFEEERREIEQRSLSRSKSEAPKYIRWYERRIKTVFKYVGAATGLASFHFGPLPLPADTLARIERLLQHPTMQTMKPRSESFRTLRVQLDKMALRHWELADDLMLFIQVLALPAFELESLTFAFSEESSRHIFERFLSPRKRNMIHVYRAHTFMHDAEHAPIDLFFQRELQANAVAEKDDWPDAHLTEPSFGESYAKGGETQVEVLRRQSQIHYPAVLRNIIGDTQRRVHYYSKSPEGLRSVVRKLLKKFKIDAAQLEQCTSLAAFMAAYCALPRIEILLPKPNSTVSEGHILLFRQRVPLREAVAQLTQVDPPGPAGLGSICRWLVGSAAAAAQHQTASARQAA